MLWRHKLISFKIETFSNGTRIIFFLLHGTRRLRRTVWLVTPTPVDGTRVPGKAMCCECPSPPWGVINLPWQCRLPYFVVYASRRKKPARTVLFSPITQQRKSRFVFRRLKTTFHNVINGENIVVQTETHTHICLCYRKQISEGKLNIFTSPNTLACIVTWKCSLCSR